MKHNLTEGVTSLVFQRQENQFPLVLFIEIWFVPLSKTDGGSLIGSCHRGACFLWGLAEASYATFKPSKMPISKERREGEEGGEEKEENEK